ncbi:MAG: tyrosine-type recombinase/integrase [Comamonas sp.]|uniref:tyrosine-type recombinase/integrase n=1 Tax=Comamonas sp. TaxID=34028 RepID=UPI002FCA3916
MKQRSLPKRVYKKHGSYWHVRSSGKKKLWTRLSSISDGLPALYRALAEVEQEDTAQDLMPALIKTWLIEVDSKHSAKTQANSAYQTRNISESFQEFRAKEVTAPSVLEFLKHFADKPRTYNAYRAMLRELMRFAEQKGFRDPGTNPVDSLKTATIKARTRYITDSEVRRIKVSAMYGDDGLRTRAGATLCALIDMAYLTGQRIGDLLTLEWSGVGKHGISFQPAKIEDSTGAKVLIEWSPRLTELVARIKLLPKSNAQFVFCTLQGKPYTYSGASTAWKRAVKRAGIKNCHFHDLRSKALTDVDKGRGIMDAQRMGAHSTQSQTAGYVRHKLAIRVGATR